MIDVAKGVEEQTEKLVKVCQMRNIPTIVFINKLDREGKDAFDLLDEIEQKLNLKVTPLSIPIGMGYDFRGIYNIFPLRELPAGGPGDSASGEAHTDGHAGMVGAMVFCSDVPPRCGGFTV